MSVYFTDNTTGYVTGDAGTILKTTNEGVSWVALPSTTTSTLNSIFFTDNTTGYAVGENGTIIKTVNGGAEWGALSGITNSMLYSVYFTSANNGVAVGGGGSVLRTTNGGGPVSVSEKSPSFSTLKIYPNPANDHITISDSDQNGFGGVTTVTILTMCGKSVKKEYFINSHRMEVDVQSLVRGIYLVKIQTEAGTCFKKLVIN